ncbi:MAG: branched-chain amino acid ABC transporter permease [Salinisphaera sp.]|nr:branched-chain amino acid ABC transporter permease [Salinisphaera sp.]
MILKRPTFWIILLATLAFALVPALTGNLELRENLLLGAVYIILASNLNLMIGYTAYVNFGNIAFFGLGGYIGLYVVNVLGWSLWPACLIAGVVVSLLAFILGTGILRLRGAYFALATIGVNEAVKAFVTNFEPFGGASGMYLSFSSFNALGGARHALWLAYFAIVVLMGLSLWLSLAIKNSRFGLGLFAIREDEDAAMVLGVRTPRYKSLVYAISAFIPAVAGTLFFFKNGVILPDQAFDLTLSIEAIVMLMLGGQGTVIGVALGAFAYEQLRGFLLVSSTFSQFQLVVAGVLLLLIVLFLPEGFMGWVYRHLPRLRRVIE